MSEVGIGGQSSTAFELLDLGTKRLDLASRREIKYALPQTDVGKLRWLLDVNCRRLIHNKRVSAVRSIYFDDVRLSACRANLDGLGQRRKVRIRWYDSPLPQREFFLEVKWRDSQVTGKHRLQLGSTVPLAELTYNRIRAELEAVTPEWLVRDLACNPEPIVIVQYNREHFAADGGLRLTLDYDITFHDQVARQSISTSFGRRLEGLVVLEGKCPVGCESELRRWLHPFTPRATRCSKYVHGCRLIGLIRDSEQ